jgi:hypothetical protein
VIPIGLFLLSNGEYAEGNEENQAEWWSDDQQ